MADGYILDNSFLYTFDYAFHAMLQQQGSQLMGIVPQEDVPGSTKYIRQQEIGAAHYVTDYGGITEYNQIKYDQRRLQPRGIACPLLLNDFDMVMQGTPDPALLATQAANECGKLIDEIILEGIHGTAYTKADGDKTLTGAESVTEGADKTSLLQNYDKTQTIPWNDCTLGGALSVEATGLYVKAGLSASKINKAVRRLREKFNYGPIACVASSYALSTARADPRMANALYNNVQTFQAGVNNPYGGVDVFVCSELVDKGTSKVNNTTGAYTANGPKVEYAYVFAINQIKLGTNMPLTLKTGQNAERYLNTTLIYEGMYDCTRMFEESVIRIEINKNPGDNGALVG